VSGQITFNAKLKRLLYVLAVSQILIIIGIVGLMSDAFLRWQSIGGPGLIFVFINILGMFHAFIYLRTQIGTPFRAQGIGILLCALVMYALNIYYGYSMVRAPFDDAHLYFTSLIMAAASLYFFMVVYIVGYCYRLKRQQAKEKIPQMG
jgi:hypothetical protein